VAGKIVYVLTFLFLLSGAFAAASLAFAVAWNRGVSQVFGMPPLQPVESLSILACAWILSSTVLGIRGR
jgi:hypothetical protein